MLMLYYCIQYRAAQVEKSGKTPNESTMTGNEPMAALTAEDEALLRDAEAARFGANG